MDLNDAGKALPVVGGVVTTMLGFWRLNNRGHRMRRLIEQDIELLDKLPESSKAKDAFAGHLDRSIERLVSSEETAASRSWDPYALIWAVIFVGMGIGLGVWAVREQHGRWEIAMWCGAAVLILLTIAALATARAEHSDKAISA